MKVAITSQGNEMTSALDPRFGRAAWILLVDTDADQIQAHENTADLDSPSGAGIQTGARVVDIGAQAVITGNVGPNAFRTLSAGSVDVFLSRSETVQDALELFKAGKLEKVDNANVEGHWV